MVESVGDSIPAIVSTSFAMIVMSLITLYVARRSGVSDIQAAASRESERLVKNQSQRIGLLETRVKELESELEKSLEREKQYLRRIDKLEQLVSDEQIRRLLHEA